MNALNALGSCCGDSRCVRPPVAGDYRGGWYGATVDAAKGGLWLTRWPDAYHCCEWVEDWDDKFTFPDRPQPVVRKRPRVYHNVLSAFVGEITDTDGKRYRPVSIAGSQYANGAGMKGNPSSEVWYQVNYAPVTDLATKRPRAGFAVVTISANGHGTGAEMIADVSFTLQQAWLLGASDYWDSADKLANYHNAAGVVAKRTVCGPGMFGLEVRDRSGSNTFTYWETGDRVATVKTWTNAEGETCPAWTCVMLDAHSAPMGLARYARVSETFAGGAVKRRQAQHRVGVIDLATMTLDTSDIESRHAMALHGDIDASRDSDGPAITVKQYWQDFGLTLRFRPPAEDEFSNSYPVFAAPLVYGVQSTGSDFDFTNYSWCPACLVTLNAPPGLPTNAGVSYTAGNGDTLEWFSLRTVALQAFNSQSTGFDPDPTTFTGEWASAEADQDDPWLKDASYTGVWPLRVWTPNHNGFYVTGWFLVDHNGDRYVLEYVGSSSRSIVPIAATEYDAANRSPQNFERAINPIEASNEDGTPYDDVTAVAGFGMQLTDAETGQSLHWNGPYAGSGDVTSPYTGDPDPWLDSAFPEDAAGQSETFLREHSSPANSFRYGTEWVAPDNKWAARWLDCPGGLFAAPPAVGEWFEADGTYHRDPTLCYDASRDTYHPTTASQTPTSLSDAGYLATFDCSP